MKIVLLWFVLALVASQERTGCPKLPVAPCVCYDGARPYLMCDNVDDPEVLRNVFDNSAGISLNVVRFQNSVLQYLPSNLFMKTSIVELEFFNSTFVQLFDDTPEDIQNLRTVHIENTSIFRGILWEHLSAMTNLRILNIYRNHIDKIDYEFENYVPKTLEQLAFYDTKTTDIKAGILASFPNLDKIAVDHCELKVLRRNMFSVPFKGRYLYFNENLLKTLPADIFTDMPNLQTVGLKGNVITTLPPSIFHTRFPNLQYFMLENNPLYCDRNLENLIKNKPPVLTGSCYGPAAFHHLPLEEVDPDKLYDY